MLSVNRLTENLFLLTTGILSLCSWVIALGGLCALGASPHSGYWLIVYELFLILGVLFVFMSGTFLHYRMALLTFLAISISLLTGQIDFAVSAANLLGQSVNQGGAGAYAAGYIIIIIVQFLWVFVFGSEPNSYLGQFGHGWTAMNNSVDNHQTAAGVKPSTQQQQQQQEYEMTTDKTMVPAGGFNNVTTNNGGPTVPTYEMQGHPAASSPQSPPMVAQHHQTSQEPAVEYKERVEALHDYSASTDDPTELSFRKGEVLEVVEKKGNWWQAKKSDGTMGIIPSNYFA
ncbi:hypothetical protein BDC45DRAFT_185919 [Circinella umbellata]|nr:hypothetical protein BDC45DRAFT_185919 [Circinella umbellata]